jgi:hypothetical protein
VNKKVIQGSVYADTDLKSSVCSHLETILNFLGEKGLVYSKNSPMVTDKGGGARRYVKGRIPFQEIMETFEIPDFIRLNEKEKTIFCTRCWCDIVEQ